MNYIFEIHSPSTYPVPINAVIEIDSNEKEDQTELWRATLAEFYQIPALWVKTRREYRADLWAAVTANQTNLFPAQVQA